MYNEIYFGDLKTSKTRLPRTTLWSKIKSSEWREDWYKLIGLGTFFGVLIPIFGSFLSTILYLASLSLN